MPTSDAAAPDWETVSDAKRLAACRTRRVAALTNAGKKKRGFDIEDAPHLVVQLQHHVFELLHLRAGGISERVHKPIKKTKFTVKKQK
jgi:hypothetical protein